MEKEAEGGNQSKNIVFSDVVFGITPFGGEGKMRLQKLENMLSLRVKQSEAQDQTTKQLFRIYLEHINCSRRKFDDEPRKKERSMRNGGGAASCGDDFDLAA